MNTIAHWLGSIFLCIVMYGALWRIFSLAGLRGWYALIPVWVFYCWARMVRMKRPLYCSLMTSIFIYGISYMIPWYVRVFGKLPQDAMADALQAVPPTILVSRMEYFIFGLFLLSLMFGFYQYIKLCWRLAEAFSFRAWLAFILIMMPPLSFALGLVIIVLSRRPFHVLESQK